MGSYSPAMSHSLHTFPALGMAVALLAACSGTQPNATGSPTPAQASSPAVAVSTTPTTAVSPSVTGIVTTGLQAPWSIGFLPDGTALVTQRDAGSVVRLLPGADGTWSRAQAGSVATVHAEGEGGLLGLVVLPGTPTRVALYWSTAVDNRVGVSQWDGTSLSPPVVILSGIPHNTFHDGGRMAVGPDGMLYIGTGDAGTPSSAQDASSLAGKILRIAPDGAIPVDNPNPRSPVFSLGHRNVQGLAFAPDGLLWASEFGAKDADELNLIVAGGNYGWPIHEGTAGDPGFVDPSVEWSPTSTSSPSGMAIARGSAWVAALVGRRLWQVPINGTQAADPISHFGSEYGRLRDVVVAPSGELWLLTNNTDGRGAPAADDDRILRLLLS